MISINNVIYLYLIVCVQCYHWTTHFGSKEKTQQFIAPNNCSSSSLPYCEDHNSYPYEDVKKLVKSRQVPKLFFGKDEPPKEDFGPRFGLYERFLCRSITKTIFPTIAKNIVDQWKYIIQLRPKDGYIQGIRVEICQRPGSECDLPESLPFGHRTMCKQKYVTRRLLSINDDGTPVADTFRIPSACGCAYIKDGSAMELFFLRMQEKGQGHNVHDFQPQEFI